MKKKIRLVHKYEDCHLDKFLDNGLIPFMILINFVIYFLLLFGIVIGFLTGEPK
jgi:hypothetical protein